MAAPGGDIMNDQDRAPHRSNDDTDPDAWGLLFAVLESSRRWHERRHKTIAGPSRSMRRKAAPATSSLRRTSRRKSTAKRRQAIR
jgi:hypothetical protein